MKTTLICLSLLFFAGRANANIIYVNHAATGNNDGTSWADAYMNLQEAFLSSQPNDTLWVAQGTYVPDRDNNGNLTPSDESTRTFYIEHELVIYGGFAATETLLSERDINANETILSGSQGVSVYSYTVFRQTVSLGSGFLLDGFTIQKGNNTVGGSGTGGGMTVYNCIGGKIQNCTFFDNLASIGGGFHAVGSEVYLWNCTFENNQANDSGGAAFANGSYINFQNCNFNNNSSGYAGAILVQGTPSVSSVIGKHIISNCLFYENTSTVYGGSAIFAYNTTPVSLFNCTLNQNTEPGGGAAGQGVIRSNGVAIEIRNSIVWEDNPLAESSANPLYTVDDCIIKGGPTAVFASSTNISDVEPLFMDSITYNFTLNSNSIAVNSGDTTGCSQYLPLEDLAENNRFNGTVDLGCYEYFCMDTVNATITYQEDLSTEEQTLSVPATQNALYEWVDCDNNYATITGPTLGANGYAVSEQGNYACIVTNGCATDTSDCYLVDYILASPELSKASLRVFPNPVQTTLYLDYAMEDMRIFTISGKLVFTSAQKLTSINVSALSPGVYFIESRHGSERFTTRFVKE